MLSKNGVLASYLLSAEPTLIGGKEWVACKRKGNQFYIEEFNTLCLSKKKTDLFFSEHYLVCDELV